MKATFGKRIYVDDYSTHVQIMLNDKKNLRSEYVLLTSHQAREVAERLLARADKVDWRKK